MKTLIIGAGEIGNALYEILHPFYETYIKDKGDLEMGGIEIMHVCFPYFGGFIEEVKKYQKQYNPKYTAIHSTVPVGTSERCSACHSPVRGAHPYLAESLKTFVKFVSGNDADTVAEYFRCAGLKVYICRKSETTELGKLLSTTYYATCIEFVKEAEQLCQVHNVPFAEAFTLFQQTYNEGWRKQDYAEYQRPVLIPIQNKQGGHCTLSNCELIKESNFANFVLKQNNRGEK